MQKMIDNTKEKEFLKHTIIDLIEGIDSEKILKIVYRFVNSLNKNRLHKKTDMGCKDKEKRQYYTVKMNEMLSDMNSLQVTKKVYEYTMFYYIRR